MAVMPWNETDVMTEKERFIMLAQTGRFTITDLEDKRGLKKGRAEKGSEYQDKRCFYLGS
jgi:hypothetical protein